MLPGTLADHHVHVQFASTDDSHHARQWIVVATSPDVDIALAGERRPCGGEEGLGRDDEEIDVRRGARDTVRGHRSRADDRVRNVRRSKRIDDILEETHDNRAA